LDYREIAQHLIDSFQTDFPIVEKPYSEMASTLQTTENEVMSTLSQMLDDELLGRIGPIYRTHRVGYSLLAACACDESRLLEVGNIINEFKEVNHNYERENALNLWFVVTAKDEESVYGVCRSIEAKCKVKVLCFPMVKPYKIDLSATEKIDWDLV
jgi:DNA-binding Lrp family transcriptional regulator